MSECPSKECHADKERISACVGNIKNDYISKGTIKWSIVLLVGIVLAFATAWGMTRREINNNTKDIAVIAESVRNGFDRVNEKLDDLKSSQKNIWKAVRKHKDDE